MKTTTLEYDNIENFNDYIDTNIEDKNSDKILVQVFTSVNNDDFISNLTKNILKKMPNAKIIGATSCGEISQKGMLHEATILSISVFQSTTLKTTLINSEESCFLMGQNIVNSLELDDTAKLLITFTDGLNVNGEEYLQGITSINKNLIVAGGMAGDYSKFEHTVVFTEKEISSTGAVAVSLSNNDLNVYTDYSFNWETVGKKHLVTKSQKNRVYTIGNRTAVDFYNYYLGDDIGRMLPEIGIEFPLVLKKDNINIARAVLTKHDDGSLSFAGNIPQDSYIQFGHGNVQLIIHKGLDTVKKIIDEPIESIFIYSCMARKALLGEDINLEIQPLSELAPIAGFFTYGEFFHNCKDNNCTNKLLNQSMTILAISENNSKIEKITPNVFCCNPAISDDVILHRTQALSTLIERTTTELEEVNLSLEERVQEEIKKNQEKEDLLHLIQTQAQLGEMIEMILHQWRQPLSAITSTVTAAQLYKDMGTLTDESLSKYFEDILHYTNHLNNTIDDFRTLYKEENELTYITPSELIEKTLTIINPALKKHNIGVIRDCDEIKKVPVTVNLLLQVLLNIVKNAIDILIENEIQNPQIKFKSYTREDKCIIKIMDNAGGIPKDILPHIFDKGFTTKSDTHGTGIGLDMSKTIIERKIGGKLTAHNVKEWAVFRFEIPLNKV